MTGRPRAATSPPDDDRDGVRPLRALLVDDEPPALAELAYLLRKDERIGEIETASSGQEALTRINDGAFDAVFCDINMPGFTGLDVARVLAARENPPSLVFVTAHDQHAVDAFEVRAIDYVLKPVREARLTEAVRRVVAARADIPRAVPKEDDDETIPVELGGVTSYLRRSQVLYAQAHGDYARLHTATSAHLVRISLTTLEERWGAAGFARIHRSTLVSLPHVTAVKVDKGHCSVFLGELELPVSRRHTRALRDRLGRAGDQWRRSEP